MLRALFSMLLAVIVLGLSFASCSPGERSGQAQSSPAGQMTASSTSWQLVYSHDQQGNAASGTVQDLISAVTAGKQIRFMFTDGEIAAIMDAQTVWIKGNVVYAQNSSLIGTSIDAANSNRVVFNAPIYHAFYNVSTQGEAVLSRWQVGAHASEGEDRYPVSLTWFAR